MATGKKRKAPRTRARTRAADPAPAPSPAQEDEEEVHGSPPPNEEEQEEEVAGGSSAPVDDQEDEEVARGSSPPVHDEEDEDGAQDEDGAHGSSPPVEDGQSLFTPRRDPSQSDSDSGERTPYGGRPSKSPTFPLLPFGYNAPYGYPRSRQGSSPAAAPAVATTSTSSARATAALINKATDVTENLRRLSQPYVRGQGSISNQNASSSATQRSVAPPRRSPPSGPVASDEDAGDSTPTSTRPKPRPIPRAEDAPPAPECPSTTCDYAYNRSSLRSKPEGYYWVQCGRTAPGLRGQFVLTAWIRLVPVPRRYILDPAAPFLEYTTFYNTTSLRWERLPAGYVPEWGSGRHSLLPGPEIDMEEQWDNACERVRILEGRRSAASPALPAPPPSASTAGGMPRGGNPALPATTRPSRSARVPQRFGDFEAHSTAGIPSLSPRKKNREEVIESDATDTRDEDFDMEKDGDAESSDEDMGDVEPEDEDDLGVQVRGKRPRPDDEDDEDAEDGQVADEEEPRARRKKGKKKKKRARHSTPPPPPRSPTPDDEHDEEPAKPRRDKGKQRAPRSASPEPGVGIPRKTILTKEGRAEIDSLVQTVENLARQYGRTPRQLLELAGFRIGLARDPSPFNIFQKWLKIQADTPRFPRGPGFAQYASDEYWKMSREEVEDRIEGWQMDLLHNEGAGGEPEFSTTAVREMTQIGHQLEDICHSLRLTTDVDLTCILTSREPVARQMSTVYASSDSVRAIAQREQVSVRALLERYITSLQAIDMGIVQADSVSLENMFGVAGGSGGAPVNADDEEAEAGVGPTARRMRLLLPLTLPVWLPPGRRRLLHNESNKDHYRRVVRMMIQVLFCQFVDVPNFTNFWKKILVLFVKYRVCLRDWPRHIPAPGTLGFEINKLEHANLTELHTAWTSGAEEQQNAPFFDHWDDETAGIARDDPAYLNIALVIGITECGEEVVLVRVRDCLPVVQELAARNARSGNNDGGRDAHPLARARARAAGAAAFVERELGGIVKGVETLGRRRIAVVRSAWMAGR
ncbi:hypothetical protein D9611_014646 [Ephemerocybe angulata]|uniref:Uncharacterized protein n=1 Tax=Ephemerocybe angulata TaxID=980116 RepID=A0A8H5FIV2_9AGAR|nr:hypothetical protein D9611_014646 [Tulosesus angulatus]